MNIELVNKNCLKKLKDLIKKINYKKSSFKEQIEARDFNFVIIKKIIFVLKICN